MEKLLQTFVIMFAIVFLPLTAIAALETVPWYRESTTNQMYTWPAASVQSARVGIGTTSPFSKLSVQASSSPATTSIFTVASSTFATLFNVLGNGNVGIGTTSPYAKLSVNGQAVAAYFTGTTTATSTFAGPIRSTCFSTDGNTCVTGGGGGVTNVATNNGLTGGPITSTGTIGLNITGLSTNALVTWNGSNLVATGTPQLTVGNLVSTTTTASSFVGNVGIGTTSPTYNLSVKGDGSSSGINFQTTDSSDVPTSVILDNGNYGIGTTTPTQSLFAYKPVATVAIGVSMGSGASGIFQAGTNNIKVMGVSDKDIVLSFNTADRILTGNGTGQLMGMTMRPTFASSLVATGWSISAPDAVMDINAPAGMDAIQVGSSTSLFNVNQNMNVGVGTSSPWRKFSVDGTLALANLSSATGQNAVCIRTNFEVVNAGANTCLTSTIRNKENVNILSNGIAIDIIEKLRSVSFDYKEGQYDSNDTKSRVGLIAEEVELVDKRLVDYGYDGKPVSIHFDEITGLLVQSVQEIFAKVTGLEKRLNDQEKRITELEAKINDLTK